MKRLSILMGASLTAFLLALSLGAKPSASPAGAQESPTGTPVERGEYLTALAGCHNCHSPKIFPDGLTPEPDPERLFSGHPANEELPAIPSGLIGPGAGQWGGITNNHFTAWVGVWGVSFARNLTPDIETGIGSWTEDMFVNVMRTGRHEGKGRAILPPMPWKMFQQLSDEDLRAIFQYLRSIPPIHNPVPDPIPPEEWIR